MTNSSEEKKIKRDGIRQVISCLVVFIPILCGGMSAGWTSPTQKFLTDVNVTRSFTPLTMEEFSWINSFLYFGGMGGCLLWNPVTEKFGRKIAGYCVGLFTIAAWSAIYVSMDFYVLLASRFALGISIVGSVVVGMAYSNEITSERLKGPLCSLGALYINMGFLMVYVCGSKFSYETLNLICLAIPVVFLVLFFRLPESPLYLMMDNQEEKAKKAMMWFRGNKVDKVGREIAAIRASPSYQIRITVKDLLTSKETAFSVFTAIMMFIGQQFSGITIITSYAESIFEKSGTGIPPERSTIIMGLLQVGGCCLPGLLVNKVNLKSMLAGSFVLAALALAVLSGSYVLFERGFQDPVTRMLPLISVLCYILSFTVGIAPIPFIMFTQMFKPNVMTLAISFGQLASNCSAFFLSKIFPSLLLYFDYSGTFALLAIFNLIMTAYVMKCVTYEASQISEKQLPPDIVKSFENGDAEKLEVDLIINA